MCNSLGLAVAKRDPWISFVRAVRAADMDVESFSEGILGAIVVNEGERANVGASIAFIAESEADLAEAKKKGGSNGAAAPAGEAECS